LWAVVWPLNDRSNVRSNRARKLGWTPKYDVEHLYATAAADAVEIAANIKAKQV
jgi:hypothetical protein